MSLRDFASGLVGNHDDDIPDDGDPKGEVPCWFCNGSGHVCACCFGPDCKKSYRVQCSECGGGGTIADAEASIEYQHPDALPAVDTAEDAGLSAVRKLKGEE